MSELWSHPMPIALSLLVAIGWLAWRPRRATPVRSLALFSCLLPSWRFFDQIEPQPVLQYRVAPHGDDWGPWQEALTAPLRTAGSLWSNAAGNLHLACQSLLEHLTADLEVAPELARAQDELVSYRLVCALVEQRVRTTSSSNLSSSPTLRYQFRLAGLEPEAAPIFLSSVHGLA